MICDLRFERMESLGMRPTWLEINLLAGENAARYVEVSFHTFHSSRPSVL